MFCGMYLWKLGIGSLSVAFSGDISATLKNLERWYVDIIAFLFIVLGIMTILVGLVALIPIVLMQQKRKKTGHSVSAIKYV
jgi:hypothetical protein